MDIMPFSPEDINLQVKIAWEIVRHIPIDSALDFAAAAVARFAHQRIHWIYIVRGVLGIVIGNR